MKKTLFLITVLSLLILAQFAYADQTVKTVEYPLAFIPQTIANNWYENNITLSSPDGIAKILSSEMYVRGDFQANTKVYFEAENQECKPTYWTTPSSDIAGYLITFDCSELTEDRTSGTYTLEFKTDKIARNIYAFAKFTYYNNPKVNLVSIGGTEYTENETARIVIQILDNQGQPVNDMDCYTTIRDSNNTKIVNNETLTYIENSSGIYFYQFDVSLPYGVYSVDNYCYVDNSTIYSADTFHMAEWTREMGIKFVGGTEYVAGEVGTFVIQFIKIVAGNEHPVNDADYCIADFFFPNSTLWLDDIDMVYIPNSNALYYNRTVIPNETGVYTVSSECKWKGIYSYDTRTFHVGTWGEALINMSVNGTLINTYELIFVSGTEYAPNENTSLSVQFLRTVAGNPNPINNGQCFVTTYYPNLTKFLNNQQMTYITGSNGIYTYNLTLPSTYGIYINDFKCKRGGIKTYTSGEFHISEWADLIYNINTSIYQNFQNLSSLINSVNTSIHNTLYSINNSIITEISNVNSSIFEKLFLIQDDLQDISNDLTLIYNLIGDVNETIMNKLYLIQDEIYSVNETIKSANNTIMNKLYLIQDDITSVNETLLYYLMNITNATWNITLKQEELLDVLIALWGEKGGKAYVYAGFTGLFGGVPADDIQFYCKDNQTLVSEKIITLQIGNATTKNYVRRVETDCTYGCFNNECRGSPSSIYFWILGLILLILFLYLVFSRWKGE